MFRKIIIILSLFTFVLLPANTYASKAQEILVTSTYGVLAGTIVGVATLAFSSNPGGRLRNIAVGASLGLYAGILLGAYLAYGVKLEPQIIEEDDDDEYYDDEEYEDEEDAYLFMQPVQEGINPVYARMDPVMFTDDPGTRYDLQNRGVSFIFPVVVYNF
jgi:hypothetical protein